MAELRRSGGVTRRSDEAELRRSCGISKEFWSDEGSGGVAELHRSGGGSAECWRAEDFAEEWQWRVVSPPRPIALAAHPANNCS